MRTVLVIEAGSPPNLSTSRRTLVRGAAWSVPVVAVAATAPAFAASPCPSVTLNWAALGAGAQFSTTTVGGVAVALTLTGATGAANNRTVSTAPTGGQSSNLRFYSTNVSGSSQTATFTFTRNGQPVSVVNLAFTFLDIDSGTNGWFDQVAVGTPGYASQIISAAFVRGSGASNDLFRPTSGGTSANTGGASTNGNVNVSWAAPLSSVSFTYSQGIAASGSPFIGISNMSFQPVIC